jgi:integrase
MITFPSGKQEAPYLIKMVVLESGERLPMLCQRSSGLPLFEATLYALTELRARNRASATILQALRAVMVLCLVLDRLGIDLDQRLSEGRLLELGDVDEVARWCCLPLEAFSTDEPKSKHASEKVVSFEKARMREFRATRAEVDPATAAVRIHYIRDYLKWRAAAQLLKLRRGSNSDNYAALKLNSDIVLGVLNERIPSSRGRNHLRQRQGMSESELATLIEVTQPTSPDNPWKGVHARERNALIVRWLLTLGVRRGELLGIRVRDLDFQTNEVLIARRADDPNDPRRLEPNTKTRDRLLALNEDLSVLTRRYITGARRRFEGARRHEYLFVANGTGVPLSLGGLNKLFVVLRTKCPNLPDELCPHVFRHTWNDEFSALMDKQKVSEETEKKMRARLMGWSETSDTAAAYTRRHTARRAREASLMLQNGLKTPNRDGD